MRRWEVQGDFGGDHLALVDAPDPGPPGPGQVRVALAAWSLNYRDCLMVEGRYDPRLAFPWVPLSDAVGHITAVGSGVTRVVVGDRVCPTFSPHWVGGPPDRQSVRQCLGGPLPGVAVEERLFSARAVVMPPAHLTDAEAATLPCAALTAWSALEGVRPGEQVLVLGSGGVSVFALQLARLAGARVIATTSTPAKAEQLKQLGADEVVLYTEDPAWGRTVRHLADDGVDRVIEVGGASTLAQSLDAVRVGGMVAVIGVVAGTSERLSVLPILMKGITCRGVFVGHRQGFEAMNRAIARHGLRPVIDRTFRFGALPEALAALKRGEHIGKIALTQ